MQRNRMAIIFVAIAIVLFGSYAAVNRGGDSQQQTNKKSQPSLDGSSATGFLDDLGISTDWLSAITSEEDTDKNNATKNVARATFEQMKQLDQNGASPFDEETANSFAVQSSIARSVNASTESLFSTISISNADLKIIANNTRDAKIRYLKALETVLGKYPVKQEYAKVEGGLQGLIERTCLGGDTKMSSEIAQTYIEMEREVMGIQVPSQWASFQGKLVTHYRQGNIIFSAIANCSKDPLKGLTVAQALPEFVLNATTLQKSLEKMYTEVGL